MIRTSTAGCGFAFSRSAIHCLPFHNTTFFETFRSVLTNGILLFCDEASDGVKKLGHGRNNINMTPAPLQFRLRTLFIATTTSAVLLWALAAPPQWMGLIAIYLVYVFLP